MIPDDSTTKSLWFILISIITVNKATQIQLYSNNIFLMNRYGFCILRDTNSIVEVSITLFCYRINANECHIRITDEIMNTSI